MRDPNEAAGGPKILVLLATYNGARFIGEQLQSLAIQDDVRIEVIASDDGSNDRTVEIALAVAADVGLALHFLAVRPPSGSSAANFYRLFRDADLECCEYVALCDQDDIWLAGKMSRAIQILRSASAGAYSCNSTAFWPDGTEKRIKKSHPQRRWDYLFESASQGCTYVITAESARRFQAFLRSRPIGLEKIQFHDWLLYAWSRSSDIPWIIDDQYLIRYRQSRDNVIGANSGAKAILARAMQLKNGWYRNQSLQIMSVLGLESTPIAEKFKRYHRFDRMWLALNARQCRRRMRDAAVFCLMCLLVGSSNEMK